LVSNQRRDSSEADDLLSKALASKRKLMPRDDSFDMDHSARLQSFKGGSALSYLNQAMLDPFQPVLQLESSQHEHLDTLSGIFVRFVSLLIMIR
jgi:hypothetical protein